MFALDDNVFTRRLVMPVIVLLWFAAMAITADEGVRAEKKPTVALQASTSEITLPCPPGIDSSSCPNVSTEVELTTLLLNFGEQVQYTYSITGGRLTGEGRKVKWDLSGLAPGTYTASVEVHDEKGNSASATVTVTIKECASCTLPCPSIQMSCTDSVKEGTDVGFSVGVSGNGHVARTYNWTVSAGRIKEGQGTPNIKVETKDLGGKTITATLEVGGGFAPECQTVTSCTTSVEK